MCRRRSVTIISLFIFLGMTVALPRGQHTAGSVPPGSGLAGPRAASPVGSGISSTERVRNTAQF